MTAIAALREAVAAKYLRDQFVDSKFNHKQKSKAMKLSLNRQDPGCCEPGSACCEGGLGCC